MSADDFLTIGPRIRVLPIIHGSGDCAIVAREELLARPYDCLAVPLPESFQAEVEQAVEALPVVSAVFRKDDDPDGEGFSYVPIDPCQPVIAAIRTAIGERIPRRFIDLETSAFQAHHGVFPDPYALKRVRIESFAAALLPAIPSPSPGQHVDRIAFMAARLRDLERKHQRILFICSILDWPWIRTAYFEQAEEPEADAIDSPVQTLPVDRDTLAFFLGELPFLTALYERGRIELTPDDNLSVDGMKELLLAARDRLRKREPRLADRVTPHLLGLDVQYARNLSLIERRLTPDLYTLVVAARQMAGDEFALAVAETARDYPHAPPTDEPLFRAGRDKAEIPGWGVMPVTSRLPGAATAWRKIELRPRPPVPDQKRWKQNWNPFGICSWPPEDDRVESFNRHVRDQARALLGADLARSEKFTTSVRDGIDIRETLRNWQSGDLYVKVIPPARGTVEIVVFLFDTPADPRQYTLRNTWYAEHADESTLAFFATDPMNDLVGPGVARAQYGGAFFLYPPRPIPDIWTDPRLDAADTLEERLLAAAMFHSRERHVCVVSPGPPGLAWRRLARRHGRRLIHIPLSRFGGEMIERLRTFHILNGREVRSYAAHFIRET